MSRLRFLAVALLSTAIVVAAHAQWRQNPTTGSVPQHLPDRSTLYGQSGMGPMIQAMLVNNDQNAKAHRIVIRVETWGVNLVSPDPNAPPRLDQAHIQYHLDNNQPVNTANKTAVFTDVPRGHHVITVLLADNHGNVLGMRDTLKVDIP
jgi:hypothetical protein